ncbi:MAG TPA: hypothetical protein VFD08_06135, partial [Clostridia bacterium]|nr:hypothetical protein [Clostridia bacterium]
SKTLDKVSQKMIEELQPYKEFVSEPFGEWLVNERRILIKAEDTTAIKAHLLSLHASKSWQFSVEVDPIESV